MLRTYKGIAVVVAEDTVKAGDVRAVITDTGKQLLTVTEVLDVVTVGTYLKNYTVRGLQVQDTPTRKELSGE